MPHKRYGVKFDYDQQNLIVLLDPIQGKQLVPHQLQMLLNNQIPQLLTVQLESINDSYRLQYDLTSKKRLLQMLQACPPSMEMFYEVAFRLVQAIANSSLYMLNEEQYILHEDFIYCGKDVADLYICYLPLLTAYTVRIEDQLRLLLLRMLATMSNLSGNDDGIIRIMKILQAEDYIIPDLRDTLKAVWMKQAISSDTTTIQTHHSSVKVVSQSSKFHLIWLNIKRLWNKPYELKSDVTQLDDVGIKQVAITGVTEVLVKKQDLANLDMQIIIIKQGKEEAVLFYEDRFIVGRNPSGVHYMDTTEGISRVHCEFLKTIDGVKVKDLGSLNGSYLNGQFLVPYKSYPFIFGDVLRIVTTEIRLAT